MINCLALKLFVKRVGDLLDYAENQARAIIRDLPDGKHDFADYIDEDAVDGWPCRIKLSLEINEDNLILILRDQTQ